MFFKDSPDDQVHIWFEAYRDVIREQRKQCMDPKEIWEGLATELIDNFDLSLRTRKAELELNSYVYSNESADEYINKIRDLTRKVNGSATEQRILKNLYDHLPQKLKLIMGPGPWHKKLLIFVLGLLL